MPVVRFGVLHANREFSAELGRLIDRKSEAAESSGHELADRTNSLPGAPFRLSISIGDRTSQCFRDHL